MSALLKKASINTSRKRGLTQRGNNVPTTSNDWAGLVFHYRNNGHSGICDITVTDRELQAKYFTAALTLNCYYKTSNMT